ncbi:MAG: hypothetical protein ABSA76_06010 [Bacteroidales bacterium]
MNKYALILSFILILSLSSAQFIIKPQLNVGNQAENLPPCIKRVTQFGERPDWSFNGKKLLFVEKTYGDFYEVELATGKIFLITGHFYYGGFIRTLYLASGDVLLSGNIRYDDANPYIHRTIKAELWILDKSYTKPPLRIGTKCYKCEAISRKNMKTAWTSRDRQYHDSFKPRKYLFNIEDIVYENGIPKLANKKIIVSNLGTPYKDIEVQNFVPSDEKTLTFSAYRFLASEGMLLNLENGTVINMSNAPDQYEEPERVFPDGKSCYVGSAKKPVTINIYKLRLDGKSTLDRMTYFSDYKGYKSLNPVISNDGKFMAFQIGKYKDLAGVGYGIFIMDLAKAKNRILN